MTDFFADLDTDFTTDAGIGAEGTPENPRQEYRENCQKCRGTGRFTRSISGGQCYACKGKGFFIRVTSPESRARANINRAQNKAEKTQQWIAAHPEIYAWIVAKGPRFEFAASLGGALVKYGFLTDAQVSTAERLRLKDIERDAHIAAQKAERVAAAPAINITKVADAIASAVAAGIKRPLLRLANFRFSWAPAGGKNPGAIYVKDVDGTYLGKVVDSKFSRAFGISEAVAAEVVEVASDPEAAAVAYGRKYGQCACCGRELSNAESIARGIGPICAGKFGW